MKKSKLILKVILPIGITLLLILQIIGAFYLLSFNELNYMVKFATAHNIEKTDAPEEDVRFDFEHLMALKITDNNIKDEEYIEYDTKKKITALSWDYIEYTLDIEAQKVDADTWEEIETYSGTRAVAFRFNVEKFRWQVESVRIP